MLIRALPHDLVGSGMSVVNTGGQLTGVLAPLIMGWLAQNAGFTAAFAFLAASTLAAALTALFTASRPANFRLAEPIVATGTPTTEDAR